MTTAMCLCALGSAYGTSRSSIGITSTGVIRPELGTKVKFEVNL